MRFVSYIFNPHGKSYTGIRYCAQFATKITVNTTLIWKLNTFLHIMKTCVYALHTHTHARAHTHATNTVVAIIRPQPSSLRTTAADHFKMLSYQYMNFHCVGRTPYIHIKGFLRWQYERALVPTNQEIWMAFWRSSEIQSAKKYRRDWNASVRGPTAGKGYIVL